MMNNLWVSVQPSAISGQIETEKSRRKQESINSCKRSAISSQPSDFTRHYNTKEREGEKVGKLPLS
ncbi:MAG: hypothetical protein ABH870_05120 [bacterium]